MKDDYNQVKYSHGVGDGIAIEDGGEGMDSYYAFGFNKLSTEEG